MILTVPQSFRDMPRWWHDQAGRRWLDQLPALAAQQCTAWQLVPDGRPQHGSNALVLPVRRDGQALALRLSPPGDDSAALEEALRLWRGRGTVRLFQVDQTVGALLLERVNAHRDLHSVPVFEAIKILGDITRELAVPVPERVQSTAQVAAAHLDEFARDWGLLGQPVPRATLDLVLEHAHDRATAGGDRAVNADLHSAQVLAAERLSWLVVDPVILRGDREYDVGRVLWDRMDELPGDQDVYRAFLTFVSAAQVPESRARSWVMLRSMSYLLWGMRRSLTIDPPKCIRLLRLFR